VLQKQQYKPKDSVFLGLPNLIALGSQPKEIDVSKNKGKMEILKI